MVKVKVEVTAKEIKKGVPQECETCPVALSILKTFKGIDKTMVDPILIHFYNTKTDSDLDSIMTPKQVGKFIRNYDDDHRFGTREKVKPFSFILKLSNKLAQVLKPKKQYVVT